MTLQNKHFSCVKPCKLLFFFLFFLCRKEAIFAQKDTEFWFVAPEISQGSLNYDRPTVFRFSTYDGPATITISQPANPAFPVQTINVAANNTGVLEFPPFYDFVENTPANTVLDKGFLIESTAPISAYYEVIGAYLSNPGLFSLKGKNALGLHFYVPFQTLIRNSDAYFPLPHASFDIVATADNTAVTITPTRALLGHAANVPFSILLNRGQTYSAEAASQIASEHPSGSSVIADKPIAITVKDDLLDGGAFYGGFCRDMMGDQIVPVEKTGTKYVIQKGLLSGPEAVFVIATADGTSVSFDGAPVATLNAGESTVLNVSGQHFVQSNAPIYVWQMTGNGCELAGEILPALDCSGSEAVRFVRTIDDVFHLFLVTHSGNQGGFSLNGSTAYIQAADFQPVPGSNGEFVAATIECSNAVVPTGQSSIVTNSTGVFQMGFLNGGPVGNGSRFGFFSDFGGQIKIAEKVMLCPGDTVRYDGLTLSEPGLYQQTRSGIQGCDTLIEITVVPATTDTTLLYAITCDSAQVGVSQQVLNNEAGCDSTVITAFVLVAQPTLADTVLLCPGESVLINGLSYTEADTTITYMSPANPGCDTLVTVLLQYSPQPPDITKIIVFCPGESVMIDGASYTQPDTVLSLLPALGCDTLATYILQLASQPTVYIGNDTTINLGDSLLLSAVLLNSGQGVQYEWQPSGSITCPTCPVTFAQPVASAIYSLYVSDINGCMSHDSRLVVVRKLPVFIPNVFAPNADNENDHFTLYASAGVEAIELLQIYDRWGSLVFENQHFAPSISHFGWDGKISGQTAAAGVYTYLIRVRLRDGSGEVFKGDLTLVK